MEFKWNISSIGCKNELILKEQPSLLLKNVEILIVKNSFITLNSLFADRANLLSCFLVITFVAVLTRFRRNYKEIEDKKPCKFPQVLWFRNVYHIPLCFHGWYTMARLWTVGLSVLDECVKKYGKTFQLPIGPLNVIATYDITIIQKLLSSNDPHHLHKSAFLYKRMLTDALHNGPFVSPPEVWLTHRKCLSKGFTFKPLTSYLSLINKYSRELKDDISGHNNGCLKDGDEFAKFTQSRLLKFSVNLVTGPGTCSDEDILQILKIREKQQNYLLYFFRHPLFFINPFWKSHPKKKTSEQETQIMYSLLRKIISNRERCKISVDSYPLSDEAHNFQPLLDLMLDLNLDEGEILANFATILVAEHDVTFAAIQFCLYYLAIHKEHQIQCRNEIDAVFISKEEISRSTANENNSPKISLDMGDLTKLKYLERCILESLRLSPPIPAFARRLQSSLKIDENVEIKSGRTVFIMPWMLHKDEDIYPNAEKFDPDRFLPENARKRHVYSSCIFSAGRRNCLGWKLALIQLKVMVAWILRNFEIRSQDKLDDLRMLFAIRLVPERNLNIEFKKRESVV